MRDWSVSMQFVAPSTKTFGGPSEQGVGWIHKRVFHGLMHAEQDGGRGSGKGAQRPDAGQLPTDAGRRGRVPGRRLLRPDDPHRDATDKYLLAGGSGSTKRTSRLRASRAIPVKSPSFWVERAHLVREYQRIGRFWLPLRDETQCHIRFVGDYLLRISYYDYRIAGQ